MDENPIKGENNRSKKISLSEFKALKPVFAGCGWGVAVNNPCDYYTGTNGEKIEVYGGRTYGRDTAWFIMN